MPEPTRQLAPEDRDRLNQIHRRELELIREGQDPETAHAVAVAEASLPEIEKPTQA